MPNFENDDRLMFAVIFSTWVNEPKRTKYANWPKLSRTEPTKNTPNGLKNILNKEEY